MYLLKLRCLLQTKNFTLIKIFIEILVNEQEGITTEKKETSKMPVSE